MSKQVRSAYEFVKCTTIDARRGPEWVFTRSSSTFFPDHDNYQTSVPANIPLIGNTYPVQQRLTNNEDISHVDWTNVGLTVAQDATDPNGNINQAWTITEDASVGGHNLSQAIAGRRDYDANNCHVWVDTNNSTARYMYLTQALMANTAYPVVIDLREKRISEKSYFGNSYEGVEDMGNGWIRVEAQTQIFVSTAGAHQFMFGIADSPDRNDIATGHAGAERTLVVWQPSSIWSQDLVLDSDAYVSSDEVVLWGRQNMLYNYLMNSGMRGYEGKGTPPDGFGYSPGYGWAEVGAGDGALAVATTTPPSDNPTADPIEANAVRCSGTASQYYLEYNGYYAFVYPSGAQTLTFSVYIEDIVVAPAGNIIDMSGVGGITGTTTADIGDIDADGWISITFNLSNVNGLNAPIKIGLGVGGNDTGDFTWSSPMLSSGAARLPYIANNGYYYYDTVGDFVPGYNELEPYGLYLGPSSEGLVERSNPTAAGGWTIQNAIALTVVNTSSWCSPNGLGTRLKSTSVGGTAQTSTTYSITTKPSTRYTVYCMISPWLEPWMHIEIVGMAAQSIYAYYHVTEKLIGTVGADAVASLESAKDSWGLALKLEFISDAVDTAADLVISNAVADGDLQVAQDGTSSTFLGGINVIEGSGDMINLSIGTPITRAADVCKRTDISDVTPEGVVYIRFRTWSDVDNEDKTLWSISDGTADDRMELRITGGNLQLVVVDGAASQVAATGATAIVAETEYTVAVYYKLNDFQVWLDGSSEVVDTSGTLPAWTQMNLGSNWNDVEQLDGFVQEFKVYSGDYASSMATISDDTYVDPASGIVCEGTRGLCRPLNRDLS